MRRELIHSCVQDTGQLVHYNRHPNRPVDPSGIRTFGLLEMAFAYTLSLTACWRRNRCSLHWNDIRPRIRLPDHRRRKCCWGAGQLPVSVHVYQPSREPAVTRHFTFPPSSDSTSVSVEVARASRRRTSPSRSTHRSCASTASRWPSQCASASCRTPVRSSFCIRTAPWIDIDAVLAAVFSAAGVPLPQFLVASVFGLPKQLTLVFAGTSNSQNGCEYSFPVCFSTFWVFLWSLC